MSTRSISLFILIVGSLWTSQSFATPLSVSESKNGLQVVVTDAQWIHPYIARTDLAVNFDVIRPNGTPVDFASPTRAVDVTWWTDAQANTDGVQLSKWVNAVNSSNNYVELPLLDPRSKIIHIRFHVRDPLITDVKAGEVTDTLHLTGVPLPKTNGLDEHFHYRLRTRLGTVLTFTDLKVTRQDSFGRSTAIVATTYKNPNVPDDTIDQITELYDSNGKWFGRGQLAATGVNLGVRDTTICNLFTPNEPFPQLPANINFIVHEHSQALERSLTWTALDTEVPLREIQIYPTHYSLFLDKSLTINHVNYRFQVVRSSRSFDYANEVWVKSPNPNITIRPVDAEMTSNSVQQRIPRSNIYNAYWHADGSPLMANETGAFINSPPLQSASTEITFQAYKHDNNTYDEIPCGKPIYLVYDKTGKLTQVNSANTRFSATGQVLLSSGTRGTKTDSLMRSF